MIRQQSMIARAPRTLGALLLAATALSVTACKKNDADAAPAKVETMLVGPENVTVVRAEQIRSGPAISGSLAPERSATIRAEMSGAVVQTYAEAGQRVRRGQALAQIDATVLRDQALSAQLRRHDGAELVRHREARGRAQRGAEQGGRDRRA